MRNPITWLLGLFRSESKSNNEEEATDTRLLELDDFLQKHVCMSTGQPSTPEGTVIFDDRALQAMTYRNAAEARDHMHIDFKCSVTTVTTAIATVGSSLRFGQAQQDFAFYWLCVNKAFDSTHQLKAVARRIAGNSQAWYDYLLELVGPVPSGNRESDV